MKALGDSSCSWTFPIVSLMSRPRSFPGPKGLAGDDVSAGRKSSLGSESGDYSPRFHRSTAERETTDYNPRPESPSAPKSSFSWWAAPPPQAKPVKLTPNIFASVFGKSVPFLLTSSTFLLFDLVMCMDRGRRYSMGARCCWPAVFRVSSGHTSTQLDEGFSVLLAPIAHRFLKSLTGTAEYLQTNWKEFEFLHIKLGPGWQQREVQELFDTIMEVPPTAGWERPPGLGTCALETVFNLCNLIHNWIRSSERHGVVGPCM